MVARIWHGYTAPATADAYERLLKEVFVEIERKAVPGYSGIQLLRRDAGDEVEFTTIMWFESLAAVKAFAGEAYETAYVPAKARALLARFDQTAVHCDVRDERRYHRPG